MKTTNSKRTPFTLDQVLDAAREAVNEKGSDYIYPGANSDCFYAKGGAPSCIVGHVVFKLDPKRFAELANVEVLAGESLDATSLEARGWLPRNFWTEEARLAMMHAQMSQDTGSTWGEALYAAENLGADAE